MVGGIREQETGDVALESEGKGSIYTGEECVCGNCTFEEKRRHVLCRQSQHERNQEQPEWNMHRALGLRIRTSTTLKFLRQPL